MVTTRSFANVTAGEEEELNNNKDNISLHTINKMQKSLTAINKSAGILTLSSGDDFKTAVDQGFIYREKAKHFLQFDYVPGEVQVISTEADYTGRLAIIGNRIKKKELCKLFRVEI